MTRSKDTTATRGATELDDDELDQVSGGHELERAFIESWRASGDADDRPTEEVAFYYNKIAFGYVRTKD